MIYTLRIFIVHEELSEIDRQCLIRLATDDELKLFDYPRPDPKGPEGNVRIPMTNWVLRKVHTKNGLEVCKVTVIDINCKVVYDEYCLPTSDINDYNTYWSGINEDDLQHTKKTFEEMRNELLALFNRETILVGHGLNNDLMMLKIVHSKIIDTQIVYPHPLRLTRRRFLKDIALSELQIKIQVGEGHDSREDAEVTMKLLLKQVD